MATAGSIRRGQEAGRALWTGRADARRVNLGEGERIASQIGGGALVVLGLAKGGLQGLVSAGIGAALVYRGTTGHCPMYESIGLGTTALERGPYNSVPAQQGVRVEESIIIDRPAEDIYIFWRDHENLPRFMSEVVSVSSVDGIHSHWLVEWPLGMRLEWDAEIHNDDPGRLIAWRSLPGGHVSTAGSVHLREVAGGRGTEVRVNQKFDPPGGKLGIGVARLFGQDPASLTRGNLRRLKQIMEAGEYSTHKEEPAGR